MDDNHRQWWRFWAKKETVAGYVASDREGGILVVFRGTSTLEEWLQDVDAKQVKFTKYVHHAGNTEEGFTNLYTTLRMSPSTHSKRLVDYLVDFGNPNITITGHSLGGALTSLLASELSVKWSQYNKTTLNLKAVTFASPCPGDKEFAEEYNSRILNTDRIVVNQDLIPKALESTVVSEIEGSFYHVGNKYTLDLTGKAKNNPLCAHHLTTYLVLLSDLLDKPLVDFDGSYSELDPECELPQNEEEE